MDAHIAKATIKAHLHGIRQGQQERRNRRAGAVKAGHHAGLAFLCCAARPRLDRPKHGAMVKLVGTSSHLP
jgi:hypothetical protein